MQRIIFLDIDGTLNRLYKIGSPDFEPRCVAALNRIVEATKAVLVLSSSWRYSIIQGTRTLDGMASILREHGIVGELIGHTPADVMDEPRYASIAEWMKSPPVQISRYCILDDDRDAFGGRPGIMVSARSGLTEEDADLAIEILCG